MKYRRFTDEELARYKRERNREMRRDFLRRLGLFLLCSFATALAYMAAQVALAAQTGQDVLFQLFEAVTQSLEAIQAQQETIAEGIATPGPAQTLFTSPALWTPLILPISTAVVYILTNAFKFHADTRARATRIASGVIAAIFAGGGSYFALGELTGVGAWSQVLIAALTAATSWGLADGWHETKRTNETGLRKSERQALPETVGGAIGRLPTVADEIRKDGDPMRIIDAFGGFEAILTGVLSRVIVGPQLILVQGALAIASPVLGEIISRAARQKQMSSRDLVAWNRETQRVRREQAERVSRETPEPAKPVSRETLPPSAVTTRPAPAPKPELDPEGDSWPYVAPDNVQDPEPPKPEVEGEI